MQVFESWRRRCGIRYRKPVIRRWETSIPKQEQRLPVVEWSSALARFQMLSGTADELPSDSKE
jgi:hypothetical protein